MSAAGKRFRADTVVAPPATWQQLPGSLLVLCICLLDEPSVVAILRVCKQWNVIDAAASRHRKHIWTHLFAVTLGVPRFDVTMDKTQYLQLRARLHKERQGWQKLLTEAKQRHHRTDQRLWAAEEELKSQLRPPTLFATAPMPAACPPSLYNLPDLLLAIDVQRGISASKGSYAHTPWEPDPSCAGKALVPLANNA